MLTRIMLRMSGLEWKNTLIPSDQKIWNEKKPEFDELALGALPVLKVSGQVFYQTFAIEEWAASKARIYLFFENFIVEFFMYHIDQEFPGFKNSIENNSLQAGLTSSDPLQNLEEKMFHETFVEVQSGFMLGIMAGIKAIGIDMAKVGLEKKKNEIKDREDSKFSKFRKLLKKSEKTLIEFLKLVRF